MARTPGTGLSAALLLTLALSAGCRSGVSEARFDAFDTRLVALVELTSAAKDRCAERSTPEERAACLDAWNEFLLALTGARGAAATAYLIGDEESLAEIERSVDWLLASVPRLLGEE